MRRIPDAMLKSTVFLYPTLEAAEMGKGYGGSGFVMAITEADDLVQEGFASPDPLDDPAHAYIVTNGHVAAKHSFVRTSDPRQPIIHVDSWMYHPEGDDVAIAHLGIVGFTQMLLGKIMHHSVFMDEAAFAAAQIGAGDQVFMIGRFTGLDERERTQPTVRAGILSIAEPVTVENKKWNYHKQLSFFAEINSKAGYSGSLVFVDIPLEIPPVKDILMYPPRPQFLGCLGMTWGLWGNYVPLLDPDTGERVPEGWVYHESTGIEMVIPAWRILEFLREDDVVKQRKQFAEEARRSVRGLRPDAIATDAVPDEATSAFTKADFDAALRKVSRRKPSLPDEGTSGTSE